MTDFEQRLLKNNGYSNKDIQFLEMYYEPKELHNLLKKVKRLNALKCKQQQREQLKQRMERDRKYRYETQCKCVVGFTIIDKLIKNDFIKSYDEILIEGNQLSEKMETILETLLINIEK